MPYVSESSLAQTRLLALRTDKTRFTASFLSGKSRSQYGFRSRSLSAEEEAALAANSTGWSTLSTASVLSENLESPAAYCHNPSRAWVCHDRDYDEIDYSPTGFSSSTVYRYYAGAPGYINITVTTDGALGITSIGSSYIPAIPSASTLQSLSAKLVRNTRPSPASFDLLRFAAEQRETPALFRMSQYVGSPSLRSVGRVYLAYLFGIKPTGADLGNLAALVLAADKPIQNLLNSEKVLERRRGYIPLYERTYTGSYQLSSVEDTTTMTSNVGPFTIKYGGLTAYGHGSYGDVIYPVIDYSYTARQTLRTFATWELFVPKPYELEKRMSGYRSKAQELLGLASLKPSTVWELTPWSWLFDWFFDFGGLLRYQQDVADGQQVMSNCGYSLVEEFTGNSIYSRNAYSPNLGKYPYFGVKSRTQPNAMCSIRRRRVTRRSGNPYSIMPTWSLTTQKWAILSALGLARGPGVPIKR